MSFFSRSRSRGHYPYENHGGGYYKRPNSSGGLLGKLFDALMGSRRHSRSFSDRPGGFYPHRHHRKSSWS